MKDKRSFLINKKITFLYKPKNLLSFIENSKFIVHLSSSLSAQSLFLNKKILCLGKNNIYLKILKNIIFNMKNRNNLKFPNKTNTKEEIFKVNKYLTKLLSMSVNSRGI